ncbi:PLP-dependent aminotransferase family protein [Pseudomonas sp. LJDD11]|uniref:aminotransferase-like domain-containing protein n=1 Tax=unclassified Pseudomonas TaxID=196821 RepID=UPI0004F630A2|nr:PLP-dependent aminotransferase family protein [Pseudomonas sp. StFLB209]MCO8165358.1 PLP-dependent aminotransferase family protein [Pseudomonas sp. 21LCFQ010]MCQ9426910.1 PLP-dependent aminotransferase family protein [Pseudomonas sp. LJDD11]BAP42097.1 GntR family transcriptional regulator/aminotransferase, class I [Pseudomonas sp. StFLB209]
MTVNLFHAALKRRLEAGEWTAGQRLPSIRKFVAERAASYHQAVSACTQLVSEGWLIAQPGRGYFVAPSVHARPPQAEPESMAGDPLFNLLQGGPHLTKLGCGWLPSAWKDTELLTKAIRRTARLEQSSLVEYGDICGHPALRQQLCVHIKRLTRIDPRPGQILTTLGATHALDLVARLLIKPGDAVFVDEPCNGNLIRLLQLAGAEVLGIRRTPQGPDITEMESHLARQPVRAFFCNSTFHNPTGGNITPNNAFNVLRLAIKHDFHIVEDDVYGDFSPTPRQTFAELDNLQRVIYIGSFSKCLSASLRVGYIACPPALVEPLTRLKMLTCVAVPAFCERFVNTILADGTYAGHMKQIRQKLIEQQNKTQRTLSKLGWQFEITPESGMFVWAQHPDIADQQPFIDRLARHNIVLMPGSAFAVSRDYRAMLRINCTHFSAGLSAHFRV